ncbi:hypothetical protein B0H19DRAFT_1240826 [Mycena capillaripes]|nr:hypothetical protein B0H19DRAFT_1240826 [Mycena capillaripes]
MPGSARCHYCLHTLKNRGAVKRHIANTPACRKKWVDALGAVTVDTHEVDDPPPTLEPEPDRPVSPTPSSDDEMEIGDEFVAPVGDDSPSPEPLHPTQSRRATVEEVMDDDDPQNLNRFVDSFPGVDGEEGESEAGIPLRRAHTLFEQMRENQKREGDSQFSPFLGSDEWELASWLSKNVSQTATDEYLELPINKKAKLSFHNNRAFLQKIDDPVIENRSRSLFRLTRTFLLLLLPALYPFGDSTITGMDELSSQDVIQRDSDSDHDSDEEFTEKEMAEIPRGPWYYTKERFTTDLKEALKASAQYGVLVDCYAAPSFAAAMRYLARTAKFQHAFEHTAFGQVIQTGEIWWIVDGEMFTETEIKKFRHTYWDRLKLNATKPLWIVPFDSQPPTGRVLYDPMSIHIRLTRIKI